MKYIFLLMTLLVSFISTKTLASDLSLKEGMIVAFAANKDPGKYILKHDGKTISVFHYYQTILSDEIYSIQAGEKFKVVIDKQKGMGLLRLKNNKHHKVWIFGDTPIDHRVDTCLETAMTTLSISGCFNEAATAWQFEFDYHYNRLMNTFDDDRKSALVKYKLQWEELIKNKQSLHFKHYQKTSGTMKKFEIAEAIATLKKQMAMSLAIYY